MRNQKKRRKFFIFTAIALVLISLVLTAALRKREVIITVQTDKVARRNLTEIVLANGKIQPVTQVVISPEVAGEIVKLPVKEGDSVKKGHLLVQIKPDSYIASRNSAEANYKSAITSRSLAQAQLEMAKKEYERNQLLFARKLISDSTMLQFKTDYDVAKLQAENAEHQEEQAKFGLDKANDDLSKTTITAPMDGTVVQLKSQLGERVLGTSFNKGTEIMTIADLSQMEARVDIGESDVVLIKPGQKARLEVDAFKGRKFTGVVTDIANSANDTSALGGGNSQSQEATKFEVRIRVQEKEQFRPGMSVTTEIETRYRTNALTVPFVSVTTRMPNGTNSVASADTNSPAGDASSNHPDRKTKDTPQPVEVAFVVEGDHVKMLPVKIGISDDNYWEITEGLSEGQEVVSGGYKAISKELQDGTKIQKGNAGSEEKK